MHQILRQSLKLMFHVYASGSVLGGLFLSYSGIIRPRGAGFYCDDRSITHTYTGDTISVVNLFLGCLLGPILFVRVAHFLHFFLFIFENIPH